MGLLIMLIKTNIVLIEGERGENEIYKEETVAFKINPFLSQFFTLSGSQQSADGILYHLKNNHILQDILKWEKINFGYEKMCAKYSNSTNEAILQALEKLKNDKEAIEMELQRSNIILHANGSISVKVPFF